MITVRYHVPPAIAFVPLAQRHHVHPTAAATCVPTVSVGLRATEQAALGTDAAAQLTETEQPTAQKS